MCRTSFPKCQAPTLHSSSPFLEVIIINRQHHLSGSDLTPPRESPHLCFHSRFGTTYYILLTTRSFSAETALSIFPTLPSPCRETANRHSTIRRKLVSVPSSPLFLLPSPELTKPPEYNGKKRLYLQGPPTHGATWVRTRETHIIPPPPPPPPPVVIPAPPPPPVIELPPPPPPPPPIVIPAKEPDIIDVIAVDVEPRRKKKSHKPRSRSRSRSRSSRREEVYIERERIVPVPVPVPVRERQEYETYRYVEGPKRLPAPSPVRRPWREEEDREVGVHVRVSEREREVSEGSDRGYYGREREYYGR